MMADVRACLRAIVLASFAMLAACSSLEPVERAAEFTPSPARTVSWEIIEAAAPHDWHALLNDGPSALDWRLRALDSAEESIDFQTFLWRFDRAGSRVLDHLLRAADRGVQVRVLVDDTFLVHEDRLLIAMSDHPNIEYRIFNPFKRRSGGFVTRQLLNVAELGRLDHRMHNKAMVVDNRVAIVGGRNIGDEYFGLDEGANFRDLELILGGATVRRISEAFDDYWNDRWSFPIDAVARSVGSEAQLAAARDVVDASLRLHEEETPEERLREWLALIETADAGDTVLFVDDPPGDNPKNRDEFPVQVASELVRLFDRATSEIVIISAYLIPTPDLEGAVERALGRGVRVRILTNSIASNNHLSAHGAYRNHVEGLLDDGAELHEVRTEARDRGRYMLSPVGGKSLALHAKALIIDDDKVFVGSANLDPRSLRINTEMGLLVRSRSFNASVRTAVEDDFDVANAWRLEKSGDGKVVWVGDGLVLDSQPATSFMQRIEDWFFAHMPIEGKL